MEAKDGRSLRGAPTSAPEPRELTFFTVGCMRQLMFMERWRLVQHMRERRVARPLCGPGGANHDKIGLALCH
jgi:hypothetical protein